MHRRKTPADKENSQTAQTAENNETAQNEQACEKDCTQNEATDKKKKKQGSKKKKDNELEEKFKQLNDTYLRMLAEYDNYRKRIAEGKGEYVLRRNFKGSFGNPACY